MTRIRFENLPSTNTPRTAENLNKLNNVVISSTEPNTGEEVWLQKGKNLFDKSTVTNGYRLDSAGVLYAETGYSTSPFIEVTSSTSYVVNYTINTLANVCYYDENKTFISRNTNTNPFTTPSTCKYIRISLLTTDLDTTQLELGSTAPSSYEEYIDKKIYTKNDNGVYEKFYEEVKSDTFKNDEVVVGSIRSKNMFNVNNNPTWIGANTTYSVSNNELTVSGNYFVGFLVNVKQNTDYFISATRTITTSTTNTGSIRIFETDQTTAITSHNTGNFTFNSGSNSQIYITFYSGTGNNGVVKFSNIQLEEGTEATNYMPYQNLNGMETYSTNETVIGTSLGKPLYRKVYEITSGITSTNSNWVNVNSLNIRDLINLKATLYSSTGTKFPMPLYDSSANYNVIFISSDNHIRGRVAIGDGGSASKIICTLEYTKTTD